MGYPDLFRLHLGGDFFGGVDGSEIEALRFKSESASESISESAKESLESALGIMVVRSRMRRQDSDIEWCQHLGIHFN